MQRLRLATQLRSGLFGVVYVLDEPSAGLHPADAEPLMEVLEQLKASGNSVFIVEHNMDLVRKADWVVDVGPAAGTGGGEVLYSGAVAGLADVKKSVTRPFLFPETEADAVAVERQAREPRGWLTVEGVTVHNLDNLDATVPLGMLVAVTGVSGSGKSTLVSRVLRDVVRDHLNGAGLPGGAVAADDDIDGAEAAAEESEGAGLSEAVLPDARADLLTVRNATGLEHVDRLVQVDQKPIGRTPRSNLATYTGLFDAVRSAFAATDLARERGYTAGRFSFNVTGGRCETCLGEGFVSVELLFLPGSYGTCPECHGTRYNEETLEVRYQGRSVADVLALTVEDAAEALSGIPAAARSLRTLLDVGLGYLRLGQPATELSGGEAQRIKLATEPSASAAVTRCTCSTSRPPVCTLPTSSCCSHSCSPSSTQATAWSSSSTTWTWWQLRTGSWTWGRRAEMRVGRWWQQAAQTMSEAPRGARRLGTSPSEHAAENSWFAIPGMPLSGSRCP